ncbi:hypothetical protein M9Y10_022949 [Tritrichomonas musculus]|uniref:YbaK/aminoacyl-tRNA synthetase-associated domain-containing protein n=1 Tax=Tritrichomonas musculus TaxID=1915356 RepID=A0ABR2KX14_9EUKA
MNFEKEVCKQSAEQPAYIKSEHMLRMMRASMLRYDRALNEAHFFPIFFAEANEIINKIDKFMGETLATPQQCFIQSKSDTEISQYLSGLIRTVRSLPIVIKNVPHVSSTLRPTILPCKSSYDLVYHYFSDKNLDSVEQFSQKLAEALNSPNLKVYPTSSGAVIVDTSVKKETVIQKRCEYVPYDKSLDSSIPPLQEIETPNIGTIDQLEQFTGKSKLDLVKAVMYSVDGKLVFANIRGDLEVSEDKLRHFLGNADYDPNVKIGLAPVELLELHGLVPGFSGLVGVKRPAECVLLVDDSVKTVSSGVTGADKKDYHFINFNVARDTKSIEKHIRWSDVAENPETIQGAIVAEIDDCKDFYPEMLGLNNKPTKAPLYKVTIRILDYIAATLGVTRKLKGAYVINVGKDETKLNLTLNELKKICPVECIIVDNRAKPNFGGKMQIAELALMQNVIVVSNKLDAETVSVNDKPVKIAELGTVFN